MSPAPSPGFRGPYADGPPAADLVIDAPPLDEFKIRDLGRMVAVVVTIVGCIVARIARTAVAERSLRVKQSAANGLVDAFIKLGPTTVKAGQLMASAGPVIPPVLAEAARRCLDEVPTFPVEHVHAAIEADLGRPFHQLFTSFDDTPLSAASIGQVHACTLPDGREAVIKVQRPDIRDQMATDLRIGYQIARIIEWTPWGKITAATEAIADLHSVTFQELNPAHEAWQQDRFREKIWAFGDNRQVTAPEVYWDFCGPHIICMERVYGIPMDNFAEMDRRGIDGQAILRLGAKVWAESAMVHGPFHGDMHAGNIWVLDDGRGCYLDFGIMGELDDEWKNLLKDLFYTCVFDLDFVRVARAYRNVGIIPPEFGTDEELGDMLSSVLSPMIVGGFGNLDIVSLMTQSIELLKQYQGIAPRELSLVAKQLLYVDRYTRYLAPDYSLTADPFIVKNIFPAEAAAKAAELGIDLDDPSALPPLGTLEPSVEAAHSNGVVPDVEEDENLVKYPFLSPEWVAAAREIREEYRDALDDAIANRADRDLPEGLIAEGSEAEALAKEALAAEIPKLKLNLVVGDMPGGAANVAAHATTTDGVELDLGHLDDPDLTITVDHDTLRAMVVDQDPQAAMMAFLSGKIVIDGDLTALLGEGSNPMALISALDLSGGGDLSAIDPDLAAVAARVKAITA